MNYRALMDFYIRDQLVRQVDMFLEHGIRRTLASSAEIDNVVWEDAGRDGIEYYSTLDDVRQGLMNLFAAGLYHLFEQQQASLHARANRVNVIVPGVREASEWTVVNEARLVANVVKHAEGRSAEELKSLRPDIFVRPVEREMGQAYVASTIDRPLAGEDLYVTLADLERFAAAERAVWLLVAAELESM